MRTGALHESHSTRMGDGNGSAGHRRVAGCAPPGREVVGRVASDAWESLVLWSGSVPLGELGGVITLDPRVRAP